jgi:hypothetical protein
MEECGPRPVFAVACEDGVTLVATYFFFVTDFFLGS